MEYEIFVQLIYAASSVLGNDHPELDHGASRQLLREELARELVERIRNPEIWFDIIEVEGSVPDPDEDDITVNIFFATPDDDSEPPEHLLLPCSKQLSEQVIDVFADVYMSHPWRVRQGSATAAAARERIGTTQYAMTRDEETVRRLLGEDVKAWLSDA